MFLRRRAKRDAEPGKVIGIPFMNLRLQWGKRVWEATLENHFIGQLEPPDRIVLLSRKLHPPKQSVQPQVSLSPLFRDASEALGNLYEAYMGLKKGELTKEANVRDPEEDEKPFYRKYLESEIRRFLFGGFGQKPPKPSPMTVRFDKMLLDMYESILFPEGRKPSIVGYEHFTAFFNFVESDPPSFKAISDGFETYARILTGLLKKGKIKAF